MSLRPAASPVGAVPDTAQPFACQEALNEIAGGLAALMAGLFFFAWAGFDLALMFVATMPWITRGRFVPSLADAASKRGPITRGSRPPFVPEFSGWRRTVLLALVVVLVVLGAARIAALSQGSMRFMAESEIERWLPLLLTAVIPCWFVISALLNRLPRHFLAGAIGLAGALAGPLLNLAWRDSLALAAAVTGFVLLADGLIARSQSCRTA